jgi:DHA1 family bicyclomycin/chloramphenicol resistance-like MFS transporter
MAMSTAASPQTSPNPPDVKLGARRLVVLGGLVALGPLSIDTYLPAFPSIEHAFGTDAAAVQLTLTTYFLGGLVGTAIGGPISDRFGRKRPMITGLLIAGLAALACALAPSVHALAAGRFVQGAASAVGVGTYAAVVRDVATGTAAARMLSLLVGVMMISPVLGPLIGGALLLAGSWRWIFVLLATCTLTWAVVFAVFFRETLPPERRRRGRAHEMAADYRALLRDRAYVGMSITNACNEGAFYAYLSGSSLVLQGVYGLSPQTFGLLFSANAIGIAACSQLNRRLLYRFAPQQLVMAGLTAGSAAGVAMVLGAALAPWSVAAIAIPMGVFVTTWGMVQPNAVSLAMEGHRDRAGSASSLIRLVSSAIGAAVAPIVGLISDDSALPLAILLSSMVLAGTLLFAGVVRGLTTRPRRPAGPPAADEAALSAPPPG